MGNPADKDQDWPHRPDPEDCRDELGYTWVEARQRDQVKQVEVKTMGHSDCYERKLS